jgi:DNA-binding response OmpR family regulator
MSRTRILILADSGLVAALADGLADHGFRIEATGALDAALAMAQAIGFDAAAVDYAVLGRRPRAALAQLNAVLGPSVCVLVPKSLRRMPDSGPVLRKPVRLQTLAAALHSLVQHEKPAAKASKRTPPAYHFDAAARQIVDPKTGQSRRLTEIETGLLTALTRAASAPLMREDLLRAVWGYNSKVSTRTLETHVYRLRQKLSWDQNRTPILETVPGGYRLAPSGKEKRR